MTVLLDTSVVLRKLFGERGALAEWPRIRAAYASRILPVELGRVVDRCRLAGEIDDSQVEHLHREARRLLRSVEVLALGEGILARAAGPMPTALGTLDAVHLATHDRQLARAARASGLEVCGA